MIFKTFDGEIDKWTDKIGIFGKSFHKIGELIEKSFEESVFNYDIEDNTSLLQALDNNFSISKKSIKSKKIDIDNIYNPLDSKSGLELLKSLLQKEEDVNKGNDTWQKYFSTLKEGEKYLIKFVQNTDLQKASVGDLKNAQEEAIEQAKAYNKSLEEYTVAAKLGNIATNLFSVGLNMITDFAISLAISKITESIYNYITAVKQAKKASAEYASDIESLQTTQSTNTKIISDLESKYKKLSSGVDHLGNNVNLTTEEYNNYHDITNQIADIMPNLVQGFDNQGNAILKVKGNLANLNSEYEKYKQNEAIKAYGEKDEDGEYKRDNVFEHAENVFEVSAGDYLSKYFGNFFKSQSTIFFETMNPEDLLKYLEIIQTMNFEQLMDVGSSIDSSNEGYALKQLLNYYGFNENTTQEEFNKIRENIKTNIEELKTDIDTSLLQLGQVGLQYAQTRNDYYKLNDTQQTFLSSVLNNLSSDFVLDNQLFNEDNLEKFVRQLTSGLQNKDVKMAMSQLYEVDTEKIALEDITEYINTISKILGVDSSILMDSFGFDYSDEIQNVKAILKDSDEDKIGALSIDDLQIASSIELTDETKAKLKREIISQLEELEKGGNVNLKVRPEIDTSELNNKGWDAGEGTATVFSSTYSNEDGTKAINFTPIIADPNTGKYLGVLSPEELQMYAEGVISGIHDDYLNLQIGTYFEGEDAINQAVNAGEQISDLHDRLFVNDEIVYSWDELIAKIEEAKQVSGYYEPPSFTETVTSVQKLTKGFDQLDTIYADLINGEDFDYGNFLDNESFKETFESLTNVTDEYKDAYDNFIQELSNSNGKLTSGVQNAFNNLATAYIEHETALDSVTESTRESTIAQLEQMGVANAKQVVDERIIANTNAKAIQEQYLAKTGNELLSLSWEQINAELNEANAGEVAIQVLARLKLQQMDITNNPINCAESIYQLYALANAAGLAGSAMENISSMNSIQKRLDTMKKNGYEGTAAYLALENQLANTTDKVNASAGSWTEFNETVYDFSPVEYSGGINSLAAAQENLADATDKVTDALEKEKEALEETKSEMEELHDAVIWFYDKQIDAIDDKIEAINEENEALEKQLENMDRVLDAIEDNYDAEIEKIQEKIDALQDENDEEERALKLEEAKRKLQEAKSRKTVLQYEKGKGFVYTVDTEKIKEAEEELESLQDEEVVHQLEKEIEKLEEAKQKWLEIPEAYEKALNEMAAMNYFGSDWRTTTLFPSDELLNEFKGSYTGTQEKIDKNEERIEKLEKEKEAIEELKEAWEDALNEYKYAQYEAQLATFFGSDYEFQLLNNSAVWRRKFADEYNNICAEIEALEERIKAANDETANAATTNAEKTKQAYDTTATAVEESVGRIKTATSEVDGGVDEVANEIAESTRGKVEEINQFVADINTALTTLQGSMSQLCDILSKMDEITLSNVIAAFGSGGGGEDSAKSSTSGFVALPSISKSGNESSSGDSGLLGAVQKVIDAIGSEGDTESLLGKIAHLNNETELTGIIDKFGSSGENGEATEGSLLSVIKFVGDAIAGESEESLLGKIVLLADKCETPMDLVIGDFTRLLDKITECVTKVEELATSIASIDTSKLEGFSLFGGLFKASGTAYTYATGSAYSSGTGNWGLSSDQPNSLVSEIGPEILVRDGKYSVIDKPTFMDLKKGDIIFNHKQTKAILNNGKKSVIDKLNEKGKAIYHKLTGSAFASGTVGSTVFDFMLKGLKIDMPSIGLGNNLKQTVKQVPVVNNQNNIVQIGDIHLHEVQDVDAFGDEIIKHLPNTVLHKVRK